MSPSPLHQTGSTPPVVLLHGAGANHRVFEAVIAELHGIEVWAFSYPGRCGSPGRPLHVVDELVVWTADQLEKHGIRDAVLVGHSLGAAVAAGVVMVRPERVRSVLMLSTPTRPAAVRAIAELWRHAAQSGSLDQVRALGFLASTPPEIVARTHHLESQTPPDVVAADWDAAYTVGDRIPPVVPQHFHFVLGSVDKMGPEADIRAWLRNVRSGSVEVWEGAGHRADVEEPWRVADAIRALRLRQ